MVSASEPDRCSPTSRTPSRLSSSRRSQSHFSSWYPRKRAKLLLSLIAFLAFVFFHNWFMLLRLQHQPDPIPKPTLRSSSVSLSLQVCALLYSYFYLYKIEHLKRLFHFQRKWNKPSNKKKSQKGNYARMLALAAHALAEVYRYLCG